MRLPLVFLVIWIGSCVVFRQTHIDVWDKDHAYYVIFPADSLGRALYYGWRPLSYLDDRAFGVGAHIGPHHLVTQTPA